MIPTVSSADTASASAASQSAARTRPSADQVFKKLDSDNKGYLTASDLVKISPAGAKAADETQAQDAFKRMDTDGDGKVTESEFKAAASKAEHAGGQHRAHGGGRAHGGASPAAGASASKTPDPADANQDGKVSEQEQQAYDAAHQQADAAVSAHAAEAVKTYDAVASAE